MRCYFVFQLVATVDFTTSFATQKQMEVGVKPLEWLYVLIWMAAIIGYCHVELIWRGILCLFLELAIIVTTLINIGCVAEDNISPIF
ncbi:hypothetical protein BRADI_1g29243v3 [Brachypodium distachyon]|uniref:Uncharacterized protein n=1 Tax=Brachypodium distachyon TaxID=15368 RepID=A0A2K2DLW2_BRADI|nr:hypothetical protein BRADI_1g29243v3 [Brachypodium distachyon]